MSESYERGRASAEDYPPDEVTREQREVVTEILDETAKFLRAQALRLAAHDAIDYWETTEDTMGSVFSKRLTASQVGDRAAMDGRNALTPWIKQEIRDALGEE